MRRALIALTAAQAVLVAACSGGSDTTQNTNPPAVQPITISVSGGGTVDEGAANAILTFNFTLSASSSSNIDINYETRSGSATQGVDFVSNAGTLTVTAGAMTGSVERILLEGPSKRSDEEWMGRTDGNKAVIVPRGDFEVGEYVDVRITASTSATLFGEVLTQSASEAA